ncbi:MAG TPA: hypothetical protein VG897_10360 [Terriglobales bacterium]|nr:hypothetical protein [Terriglobales bacterium]
MKRIRQFACVVLLAVAAASMAAQWMTPYRYDMQLRDEIPNASPSKHHWLGTDDLGRDRLSRVLYGTRVSLLLAPAAALLATILAASVGILAGYLGGGW